MTHASDERTFRVIWYAVQYNPMQRVTHFLHFIGKSVVTSSLPDSHAQDGFRYNLTPCFTLAGSV